MRLSAPIFYLKRKARQLSREAQIPHLTALDRVATEEGFWNWSLLAAKAAAGSPARLIVDYLNNGDMLVVASRPGHGKTLFSLELLIEAMKTGRRGVFFTLEYAERDVLARFRALNTDPRHFESLFAFEDSNAICADYISSKLESAPAGTFAVVDYLQLLDQKRTNPELTVQLAQLRSFAKRKGLVLVFVSQVDRTFFPSLDRPVPGIGDIRLANPLDLGLFDKGCFLHDGKIEIAALN